MKTKRPSKNSRCPCGSGKRYKKCCQKKHVPPIDINKVRKIFKEKEEARQRFTDQYGHIRPPIAAKMGDKVFAVVGGSIYKQTQDGPYNFVNVIHDHALSFFGIKYLEKEEAKPFEQRHPAIQWMHTFVEHLQKLKNEGNENHKEGQIGAGAAWIRFAYDLFTIHDNAKLESHLKERLLTVNEFQGARHELWVAALCIAANFNIEFEDETDNSSTHPEFVAIDRETSLKIAVEAKSRHRRGVKGFSSGSTLQPGEKVNIRGLVMDAYKKDTKIPLYVFVDVNLPITENDDWNRWIEEIDVTMSNLSLEGYANPCPANIVFFYNDPSHYITTTQIGNESDKLWITHYIADNPRIAHPGIDICGRFMKAYRQRVAPPVDFPEFN